VDEVLAVGDEAFAHRCLDTIAEFSRRGKTIFFVSHSLVLVEELCDRVLYLEHGRVKGLGDPREMLAAYRLDVAAGEGARLAMEHRKDQEILRAPAHSPIEENPPLPDAPRKQDAEPPPEQSLEQKTPLRRWGNRDVSITGCRLLDASGVERYAFRSGESVTIEIAVAPRVPTADFVFGIGIFTPDEVCVHGTNTEIDGFLPKSFDGPGTVCVTLPRLDLGTGTYLVDVAVHSQRETPYDYWRGACRFQVDSEDKSAGLYRPERRWTFSGGVSVGAR
jgi:hypothetical protein